MTSGAGGILHRGNYDGEKVDVSAAAKRTWVIEPGTDESGRLVVDEQGLADLFDRLRHVGIAVGGMVEIVFDRVKMGVMPDGEPIAETLGAVVKWRTIPMLNDSPMTASLMDYVLGDDDDEPEPAAALADRIGEVLEEDLAADLPNQGDTAAHDAAQGDEGDDDGVECDCEGDHVPPCPFAFVAAD